MTNEVCKKGLWFIPVSKKLALIIIIHDFHPLWQSCIAAIKKSKDNIGAVKTKDVVFVYISLDKTLKIGRPR